MLLQQLIEYLSPSIFEIQKWNTGIDFTSYVYRPIIVVNQTYTESDSFAVVSTWSMNKANKDIV